MQLGKIIEPVHLLSIGDPDTEIVLIEMIGRGGRLPGLVTQAMQYLLYGLESLVLIIRLETLPDDISPLPGYPLLMNRQPPVIAAPRVTQVFDQLLLIFDLIGWERELPRK